MGTPRRISGASQVKQARQVTYDAGEKLKGAVDSILTNDSNQHIDSNISSLEASLRNNGVRSTRFVGQLLYSFRGVQQGVPGDLSKFKQAVSKAQAAGALGPRGAAQLLAQVGAQASRQDNQSRVDNSMLSVDNQPGAQRPFETLFNSPILRGTPAQRKADDSFLSKKPKPVATQKKQEVTKPAPQQVSPALEKAISSLDLALEPMPEGTVKSALEAVNSSLKLAKTAQSNGDTAAYTRAIADLGKKTFTLVGSLVKTFGQNPELAEQAASQLGKIAKVFGKVSGPLKAIEDASRVFTGKSLSGAPVDKNARADAAVDLLSNALPGPVKAAVAITKAEIEALYNHLGVPVHRALEDYGLKRLFAGKTPAQMKELINALPTDAANANATVRKLLSVFPNSTSGSGRATANDLWRTSMAEAMSSDSEALKSMVNQNPKKPQVVPDMLREVVAERMKSAALRFVDEQVRQAKGNW